MDEGGGSIRAALQCDPEGTGVIEPHPAIEQQSDIDGSAGPPGGPPGGHLTPAVFDPRIRVTGCGPAPWADAPGEPIGSGKIKVYRLAARIATAQPEPDRFCDHDGGLLGRQRTIDARRGYGRGTENHSAGQACEEVCPHHGRLSSGKDDAVESTL